MHKFSIFFEKSVSLSCNVLLSYSLTCLVSNRQHPFKTSPFGWIPHDITLHIDYLVSTFVCCNLSVLELEGGNLKTNRAQNVFVSISSPLSLSLSLSLYLVALD